MGYLVKKRLKLLHDGLEREVGQQIANANFATCPALRDALLDEGAIEPITAEEPAERPARKKGGKNAVS